MLDLTVDDELRCLTEARELVILAMGKIPGVGPDWVKCDHVLHYLDEQRNPLLAILLADPLADPMDLDIAALVIPEVLQ